MDKEQTLDEFWNSFGWKAYDENTIPKGTPLPYITYTVVVDSIGNDVALSASLWQRSTSWQGVTEMKDAIGERLGLGGKIFPFGDGAIWLKRGQPFAQRMSDEDDGIRRIYINITAEFISAD